MADPGRRRCRGERLFDGAMLGALGQQRRAGGCGCARVGGCGGTRDKRDAGSATGEGRLGGGACARGLRWLTTTKAVPGID